MITSILLYLLSLSWFRQVDSRCVTLSPPGNLTDFPPVVFPNPPLPAIGDPFPSVCYGLFPNIDPTRLPGGSTTNTGGVPAFEIERDIATLPLLWLALSPACRVAMAQYTCSFAYIPQTPCSTSITQMCDAACYGLSQNVTGVPLCSSDELALAADMIPSWMTLNCSSLPQTGCAGATPATTFSFPSCEAYTGSVCKNLINGPVYIPVGHTQADMEANIAAKQFLLPLAPRSTGCDVAFAKYMCAQTFMPCQQVTLHHIDVSLPQLPSQSLCLDYQDKCDLLFNNPNRQTPNFQFAGPSHVLYPNCSQHLYAPGRGRLRDGSWAPTVGPDFPAINFTFPPYTTPGLASSVNSYSQFTTVTSAAFNIQCPKPLVIPDNPNAQPVKDGVLCARPCPSYAFLDSEYDQADAIMWVVSTLSFICAIYLILTYCIFRQKRKQKIVFIFVSIVFIISTLVWVSTVIYGSHGHTADIGCLNNAELMPTSHFSWCTFSGTLEVFFTLFASCWWLVSAFDLFLRVVLDRRYAPASKQQGRLWLGYNIFAAVVPLNAIIIGLSLETLGGSDGLAWCALSNQNYSNVQYYVEFIPLTLISIVGLIFMLAIMRTLCSSSRKAGTHTTPGWWRKYIRPVVFILAFFFVWTSFFVVRFGTYASEGIWDDSSNDFTQCLMVDQYIGLRSCPPKPEQVPSVGLWLMIHLSVSAPGIWLFLIYGYQRENFDLWSELFVDKFGWQCCKRSGIRRQSVGGSSDKTPTHGSRNKDTTEKHATVEAHPLHLQKGINDIDLAAELAPERGVEVSVPAFDFGDDPITKSQPQSGNTSPTNASSATSTVVSASEPIKRGSQHLNVEIKDSSGGSGKNSPAAGDRQRTPSNGATTTTAATTTSNTTSERQRTPSSSPTGKKAETTATATTAATSEPSPAGKNKQSTESMLRQIAKHEYTSSAELLKFIEEEEQNKPDFLPPAETTASGSPRNKSSADQTQPVSPNPSHMPSSSSSDIRVGTNESPETGSRAISGSVPEGPE